MIVADKLVKRHGADEILKGVSLKISSGETAAIVGLSGCGKTTFLRCVIGLEPFQGGSVTVGEHRIDGSMTESERSKVLVHVRKQIGMVFQSFHLFPHMTALQNVIEAPIQVLKQPRSQAIQEAQKLLERVGLTNHSHKKPSDLSGGQQQRVAIARALAMKPKAILFDEPTSALDPTMTAEVQAVITDLARDQLAIVLVTHSLTLAKNVANTVHVFHQGLVAESGPPSTVFQSPQHPATQKLLEASHQS